MPPPTPIPWAHPWWCRRCLRCPVPRGRLSPSCCAAWLAARWSPPAGSAAPAHTAAPAAIFGCEFLLSPGNHGKPAGEEGRNQLGELRAHSFAGFPNPWGEEKHPQGWGASAELIRTWTPPSWRSQAGQQVTAPESPPVPTMCPFPGNGTHQTGGTDRHTQHESPWDAVSIPVLCRPGAQGVQWDVSMHRVCTGTSPSAGCAVGHVSTGCPLGAGTLPGAACPLSEPSKLYL